VRCLGVSPSLLSRFFHFCTLREGSPVTYQALLPPLLLLLPLLLCAISRPLALEMQTRVGHGLLGSGG
jgi:hypothetical protein